MLTDKELKFICNRLKELKVNIEFGICQGVRNGYEVRCFQKQFTSGKIIGTDIAPVKGEGLFQWDFHKLNVDWINKADFIYTNSLDHSFDPHLALTTWKKYLKDNGVLIVNWTRHSYKEPNKTDCFSGSLVEYQNLIRHSGYAIMEVNVVKSDCDTYLIFSMKEKEK